MMDSVDCIKMYLLSIGIIAVQQAYDFMTSQVLLKNFEKKMGCQWNGACIVTDNIGPGSTAACNQKLTKKFET